MEATNLLSTLLFLVLVAGRSRAQPRDGIVITQQDYRGLQAFKHSVSDPRGFLRSWNGTGIGACSGAWTGIKCVRGKVIAIALPWRGLGGHITEKIGQLTALRKLSLHDNYIGGQIPSAIGFLREIRGVYLFNNRFSGSVPPSIGNCFMLQALDLSNNLLTGSIPTLIANSTRLFRLNLSYNNFSGSIPVGIARIASLSLLFLQHNNLSGSIPDDWERTQLRYLNLDHNSISGEIPISLTRQPMLEELVLGNNQMNGSIPKEIGNLSRLRTLDISENKLIREIPSSLDHLANLTSFNVSYNNLLGAVPLLLAKKFNSSSFRGNIQLCGYSTSLPCVSPNLPSQSVPAAESKSKHHKLNIKLIVLIAVGIAIGLLFLVCCLLLCCLLRKTTASSEKSSEKERAAPESKAAAAAAEAKAAAGGGDGGGKLVHFDGPTVFTADDLLCATAEILGKSTYGTVYRATLEDGSQVAVKRLRGEYAKGPKEFEVEVNGIGKAQHPNLLELRAYYLGPKKEKLLVFDFMPKGSLAAFLHARGPDTFIDWPTRLSIAMGISRGLSYLHNNLSVIHGNVTSNNVLLDENLNPKVADFGLSRLMTPAANSNAIAAAAALGYRAPELHNMKKANTKTDVYSFGVIMLELLTGKSPSGAMNNGMELPQWVASVVKEEWTSEVFDTELMRDIEAGDEIVEALKLALQCVDPLPAARPELQQVLQHLQEIRPELAGGAVAGTPAAGAVGSLEEGSAATAGASAGSWISLQTTD